MLKISAIFLVLIVSVCNVYAANCQLIDTQNGSNGLVEFSCDQDVSLDDNKVIFYIVGKDVEIDSIKVSRGDIDFTIDQVTKNVKRVSLNIVKKTILDFELDYIAYRQQPVKLIIQAKKDSNLDYQILWGGVVRNSYTNTKNNNNNNNFQFYITKSKLFVVKNGLECSIKGDCDANINIADQNDSPQANELLQKLATYFDFGIVHQRLV
ncbi:hypothetical protein IBE10_00845 [Francisella tularensis subsp. novicida]|uniref:hypothetical protein n=1 Tax=Francisella tularensis TaxID=263 RepID=UPI0008FD198D|nr:hypothetical protein [Francisella tularensis]APC95204.1 putative pilus assembly protein [Francisella tularensis subsp. novicida]MBK2345489.1 hypothetical protein [Francisella tularensis subsp. novicida]